VSAILGYGEPARVADEAIEYRHAHGITSFKVKGGRNAVLDAAVCRAVRAAVGGDALIYVDANHAYDIFELLRFARAVADLDIAWIEEPTPAERVVERDRAVREGALTVLADESCPSSYDVAREVLSGRAQAVSVKVGRSAYLDSDRSRGFCEALGVPIIMGSQGESALGVLSCVAYAAAHESTARYPTEYSYHLKLDGSLLAEEPVLCDGRLHVPEGDGAGIVLDDERLDYFRLDNGD
jgi:L-alanine-DL-glutamate epimerase-like enolase superfamily enzyme